MDKVSTRKEVNFRSGVHRNVNNDDALHGLGNFRSKVSKLGKKKWRKIGRKKQPMPHSRKQTRTRAPAHRLSHRCDTQICGLLQGGGLQFHTYKHQA